MRRRDALGLRGRTARRSLREFGKLHKRRPPSNVVVQKQVRRCEDGRAGNISAGHCLPVVAEHAMIGRTFDWSFEMLDGVFEDEIGAAHAVRVGGHRPRKHGQQAATNERPGEGPGGEYPNRGSHAGFTL